jgi:hypothetical protein
VGQQRLDTLESMSTSPLSTASSDAGPLYGNVLDIDACGVLQLLHAEVSGVPLPGEL